MAMRMYGEPPYYKSTAKKSFHHREKKIVYVASYINLPLCKILSIKALALLGLSLFSAATLSAVPLYADENLSAKCNFLFDSLEKGAYYGKLHKFYR